MRETVKMFRSYRDAAKEIAKFSTEDAYLYLMAILDYGLDEAEPELSGTAAAMFMLTRPYLDVSIRKAESGAKGGSTSGSSESKPEANDKQTISKPEAKEECRKKNVESKNVEVPPKAPHGAKRSDAEFEIFWSAYPTKVGKQPARKAFDKVKVPVETLVAAIERQKCSSQWSKDGGQYIPNPATWLNQCRWEDELPEAAKSVWNGTQRPLDADETAAIRRMFAPSGAGGADGKLPHP